MCNKSFKTLTLSGTNHEHKKKKIQNISILTFQIYVSYNTKIFVFCFKTLALSGSSHTNKRILKESYLTGCNRSLFIYFLLLPLTRQHFSVLKLKTFISKSVDRKWSKSYYLIRLSSFIKLSSVERALRPTGILPVML